MPNLSAHTYQEFSARGASPLGQVVALYDTILRDFRRALAAHQAGQIETRVCELNHALIVIAHLQSVLDHAKGAEVAGRLSRFYDVTRALIQEVAVTPSSHNIQKLIDLYAPLRQAWSQIAEVPTANLPAKPIDNLMGTPVAQSGQSVPAAAEAIRSSWSA